ncbi:MAG: 2,3-epoxybenzoyl-CoA dihydrolase [Planctomycetota bacterium]
MKQVPVSFQVQPSRYKHWRLELEGPIARLYMQVQPDQGLREGYELKLNSYDLGVDIELADVVRRLRFEHPETNTLVIASGNDRAFCAGANIHMLGSSTHAWKVNFCKFTNETRCEVEQLSEKSGYRTLAALNGTCAGGGYELALACDEIWLVEDGNSAVSLPETPLLGVLPGTGGLTRLVDKRKVRRDRADVFCTLAEGLRGKRAKQWRLIDEYRPRSKFDESIRERAAEIAKGGADKSGRRGIQLGPLAVTATENARRYSTVAIEHDPELRVADLTVMGPTDPPPSGVAEIHALGDQFWPLRFARELDDALCDLRFNQRRTGVVRVRTKGDLERVRAYDQLLLDHASDWLVHETTLLLARTLQRFERTACSFFALVEPGSCFAGTLLELALASDRTYMLDVDGVEVAQTPMNEGPLPMTSRITRNACRLLGEPELLASLEGDYEPKDAGAADEAGLVTEVLDEIDYEDTVRIAVEERVSLSPDSLTGMEANLRFAGPESPETKIFGRLTAWQNWIFIRPNATGPTGALTLYGKPERPDFDFSRV